jgi:hypothetical protein
VKGKEKEKASELGQARPAASWQHLGRTCTPVPVDVQKQKLGAGKGTGPKHELHQGELNRLSESTENFAERCNIEVGKEGGGGGGGGQEEEACMWVRPGLGAKKTTTTKNNNNNKHAG